MNLVTYTSEFAYLRVSQVIWATNGLSRISNVDQDAGQELSKLISESKDHSSHFVIDFKNVVSITDGALSGFFKDVIKFKKEIHFVNCHQIKQMIRGLYDEFKSLSETNLHDFDNRIILSKDSSYTLSMATAELLSGINTQIDAKIIDIVKNCFVPNDDSKNVFKTLSSTPILASGQYDASLIIANPSHFTLVSLRMADLVQQLITENNILDAQLLSVSLRASPFANAISLLLNINMRTIDNLGPFQKVWDFETFNKYSFPNTQYIFIGDFIVGGTEMKLAQLFAKYCRSGLENAVAIGSVFEPNRFEGYNVRTLLSINNLNKKCSYLLFE